MDKQFLEFWGNLLLNAAKSQKQLEDMTQWIGRGFSGFDELTDMFRKFYGLEGLALDSPDYPKAWEKASENFKTSFNDWLAFMKVVPEREHTALEKKYEALKEKVATQDETIRYLRNLLSEKNVPYTDAVQNFTEMMEKQAQQFHDLMESAGKAFKKE
ncbi:MAG: hypothetical protein IMF02_08700 [Proteobacteria bacterium]|jgi:DnaJ-domain-containing protein 1|nr:hypothetical protein [Pseudomonadota bacterium]